VLTTNRCPYRTTSFADWVAESMYASAHGTIRTAAPSGE
jgi:hypothetical protein